MAETTMYMGIDPGASGGIAVIAEAGIPIVVQKLDGMTERDVLDLMREFAPSIRMARIEEVHAMPTNGSVSGFKLGRSYGSLRMALIASGIRFETASPIQWQNFMKCRTGGDKNVSKSRAQILFPTQKITHAIADALLLAEFARRVEGGCKGD